MKESITEVLEEELRGQVQYVGDLVDGSEAWHAMRAQGIGSSEVASTMGMSSSYKSAYEFWAEKTGYKQPEEVDHKTEERFYWGHASEDMIAQRFREEHPGWVVENTGTWRDNKRQYQIVNPDRLVFDTRTLEIGVLEIKTSENGYGWEAGKVPQNYVAQVRYQLSALRLERGWIAVKIGNSEYREYSIPLDATKPIVNTHTGEAQFETTISEENILACIEGFLRCVETNTPPAIDGSVSAWNTVRELNPLRSEDSRVEVSLEDAMELLESKMEYETAEARFRKAKSNLLHQMRIAHRAYYVDKQGKEQPLARRDRAPRGNNYYLKVIGRK